MPAHSSPPQSEPRTDDVPIGAETAPTSTYHAALVQVSHHQAQAAPLAAHNPPQTAPCVPASEWPPHPAGTRNIYLEMLLENLEHQVEVLRSTKLDVERLKDRKRRHREEVEALEYRIRERDDEIRELGERCEEQEDRLEDQEEMIAEQDEYIVVQGRKIRMLNAKIRRQERRIRGFEEEQEDEVAMGMDGFHRRRRRVSVRMRSEVGMGM